MSISKVDICNLGILATGDKTQINSLTEDSTNARLCSKFYPMVLDALLRSHPWNCAIARKVITPLAEAPVSDYDVQYQWPVNPYCLRVLWVGEDRDDPPIVWEPEGRKILTNAGKNIKIRFIKRITDTNEFDALLVDALVLKLAIKLAMPLTNKPEVKKALVEELETLALPDARTIDAQERSQQTMRQTQWNRSRY